MEHRPLRLYSQTFASGATHHLTIGTTGGTPCRAKAAAFLALEQTLVARPELPRTGWRLVTQVDVTHLTVGGPRPV